MGLNLVESGHAERSGEAGAPRIEITSEMINAGVAALRAVAIDGDLGRSRFAIEEAVRDVYRAMIETKDAGNQDP